MGRAYFQKLVVLLLAVTIAIVACDRSSDEEPIGAGGYPSGGSPDAEAGSAGDASSGLGNGGQGAAPALALGGAGSPGAGGQAGSVGRGGLAGAEAGGQAGAENLGGGPSGCVEITPYGDPVVAAVGYRADYTYDVEPVFGGAGEADVLRLNFFASAGSDDVAHVDLGTGGNNVDENGLCIRCVIATVHEAGTEKSYLASSGSMEIEADSDELNGTPNLTLKNVTLRETKFNSETDEYHRVPGGGCLFIDTFEVYVAP